MTAVRAVAVQLDFRDTTLEQYDQCIERMGLLPGGPAVRENLFHWVTETDGGVRCIDVWESRAAFEAFMDARMLPVLPELGVLDPPKIQFFEVHNYLAGRRWRS
jgi:hypothetical protein